jgi:hypothetical protein
VVLRRWLVDRRAQWVPFLAILLPFSLLYFWRQSIFPDHPWAMRRFLPVILPGTCIAMAAAVSSLWQMGRWRRVARLAAVIAVGAVVTHEGLMTQPFWSFRERRGAIRQVADLAGRIPKRSILLYGHPGQEVLVGTPLAFYFERDVLPVMRADDDPFGEKRDSIFQQQVMRWLRQGRTVLYLVGSDGNSVFMTPRVRWTPLASVTVKIPTIGASIEHAPQRPQSYDLHLQLLRAAETTPGSESTCMQTLPGMAEPLLGVGQGLYGPERRGSYRWAMPASRIVFPPCDRTGASRPRAVRVLASCGRRAAPEQCRVAVALNGAPLGTVQLTAAFREHTLAVSPQTVFGNEPAEVRFHGSRWVPAEAGVNGDGRELSFQLASLTLVTGSTDGH